MKQVLRINPANEKAKSLLNDLEKLELPLEKPTNTQTVQPKQDKVLSPVPSYNPNQKISLLDVLQY